MGSLVFNAEDHSYVMDGIQLPSVTTILKGAGVIDGRWFNPAATDRGFKVHQMLEFFDDESLDESDIDDQLLPYLDGWRNFREETSLRIIDIEKAVWHPSLNYAGTVDRFGLINGEPHIIEIKTGQPAKWHSLQTAAYEACYQKLPYYQSQHESREMKRIAVYLNEKKKYKVIEHPDNRGDFSVFISSLNVYKWMNKGGGKNE